MDRERVRKAEWGAWVGIVGNLLLAILKGSIGLIANSRALLADAVHSASDVVGSLAVLIGVRVAKVPPDKDHPYGHGKAESIAAIIVSVLLGVVGLEIGYQSFQALFEPIEAPGGLAVIAALVSMLAKEGMFQYKYRLGKRIGSQAVIANAWEHRSDVYSSIAALVGIGGAVLGERWGISFLLYLDPIAGVLVSLLVLRMAYHLAKESIHNTLDHVLHDEDAQDLVEAAAKVDGVLRVDELLAREHGFYVIVDVKVAVEPGITVEEGHRVGKEVKERLMKDFHHVSNVFVHINPYRSKHHQQDDF
ncbi:MAG: cation diffusion facilitator family transporter [Firmicutes bacterium]|uniref:Cation diffusion facilitator family transporter n=1 Tax=Melghirimyces thermohalophilus TaxID=1236220 RepID=A0A1G6JIF1_9BACL|nr:cation diffusion facilitator family transporter [Melghirimyces thermohalophilus]MDA8351929.1 cation diffusion facilitator family transporter [Bacillota bacterium]SDC18461.1 cation diffusion facilitator family transporter [Melghirimyces thermohalophilus]